MPVGKGSIARATSASNTSNSPIERPLKKMTDVLTDIPVNQITPVPEDWTPGKSSEQSAKELIQSIKLYGMIEPVILRRIGDNQFQLLSGRKRLQAVKEMGLEYISSRVIVELSDEEAKEIHKELHINQKSERINLHEAKFEAAARVNKDMPVYLL